VFSQFILRTKVNSAPGAQYHARLRQLYASRVATHSRISQELNNQRAVPWISAVLRGTAQKTRVGKEIFHVMAGRMS
jgi:hypothetical protein